VDVAHRRGGAVHEIGEAVGLIVDARQVAVLR
jgi:hypothetical protein